MPVSHRRELWLFPIGSASLGILISAAAPMNLKAPALAELTLVASPTPSDPQVSPTVPAHLPSSTVHSHSAVDQRQLFLNPRESSPGSLCPHSLSIDHPDPCHAVLSSLRGVTVLLILEFAGLNDCLPPNRYSICIKEMNMPPSIPQIMGRPCTERWQKMAEMSRTGLHTRAALSPFHPPPPPALRVAALALS